LYFINTSGKYFDNNIQSVLHLFCKSTIGVEATSQFDVDFKLDFGRRTSGQIKHKLRPPNNVSTTSCPDVYWHLDFDVGTDNVVYWSL